MPRRCRSSSFAAVAASFAASFAAFVAAFLVVALASSPASAASTGTFFSTPALLKQTFAASERVGFVKVAPGGAAAPVNVFVATSAGRVDGYAVVLDEQGQHEPITFFVAADGAGVVTRVEVVAYRENYGHEIRSPRYLQQFVGRRLPEGPAPARVDVDAISGATISSRSAGRAVARALALVRLARALPPPSSPAPPSPPRP